MDRLAALQAFTRVVEHGGFAAAARTLGVARSTVHKAVVALERDLDTHLLRRSTRRVSPTAAGVALHARASRLLAEVDEALRAVSELDERPVGPLRVNAPHSFGTLRLSAVVAAFAARHPEVRVELALSDRFVDPIEEGYDVTVRVAEPRHATSLIAREIAPVARMLCASPAYLARRGAPADPGALRDHDCLHYGRLEEGAVWRLVGPDGDRAVHLRPVLYSNNGEVLRDAAAAGRGIALLPDFIAAPAIATGALATVLDAHRPAPISLHALYPRHRHLSPKVRLFVDFLAQSLGVRG